MDSWIALNEYSTKYKVSVSTLRRRIKATDIKFRLEDGKYLIQDEPISAHQRTHRPSQDPTSTLVSTSLPSHSKESPPLANSRGQASSEAKNKPENKLENNKANPQIENGKISATEINDTKPKSILRANKDEPILTAANRLLNELKKAYSQILQEKEEQILQLKDEQADLKTLIRVLEGENQRLKSLQK